MSEVQRQGLRYLMYRELRLKEAALADQVRVAALSGFVTEDRIALYFPELMPQQGANIVRTTPEEALVVAEVEDDFEGTTVFDMPAEDVVDVLKAMGQNITLDDLRDA